MGIRGPRFFPLGFPSLTKGLGPDLMVSSSFEVFILNLCYIRSTVKWNIQSSSYIGKGGVQAPCFKDKESQPRWVGGPRSPTTQWQMNRDRDFSASAILHSPFLKTILPRWRQLGSIYLIKETFIEYHIHRSPFTRHVVSCQDVQMRGCAWKSILIVWRLKTGL